MLVLTRKPGESIKIGDEIIVTVHRINRDTIRLAIEAPRHVSVDRGEVRERKEGEGK